MAKRRGNWRNSDFLLLFHGPVRAAAFWSLIAFLGFLAFGLMLFGEGGNSTLRENLAKNYHVVLLGATGAVGTLVFKGVQDRNDRRTQEREERRQASDAFFRWVEKLESPALRGSAWRAIHDYAIREPSLEQQAVALAQGAVQRWMTDTAVDPPVPKNPAPQQEDDPSQVSQSLADNEGTDSINLAALSVSKTPPRRDAQGILESRPVIRSRRQRKAERDVRAAVAAPPVSQQDIVLAWDCVQRILASPGSTQSTSQLDLQSPFVADSADAGSRRRLVHFPIDEVRLTPRAGRMVDFSKIDLGPRPVYIVVDSSSRDGVVSLPQGIACDATVEIRGAVEWGELRVSDTTQIALSRDSGLTIGLLTIETGGRVIIGLSDGAFVRVASSSINGELLIAAFPRKLPDSSPGKVVGVKIEIAGTIGTSGKLSTLSDKEVRGWKPDKPFNNWWDKEYAPPSLSASTFICKVTVESRDWGAGLLELTGLKANARSKLRIDVDASHEMRWERIEVDGGSTLSISNSGSGSVTWRT